jgi:RNA polymerase sigma factor (sigma-70 family)
MTPPATKGWLLDLAHTSDEVLLLLAREARQQAAGDELTCRYWRYLRIRLGQRSAHCRLNQWDREDAQQQAYFWIQEAIRAYDFGQLLQPGGSTFRTFLHRVVRLRLLNFCRSLRRSRQWHSATTPPGHRPKDPLDQQPAVGGEQEQAYFHLERVLGALDPSDQAVWNELCQGKRLREVAQTLRVSYRTVKRRWRRLRQRLASSTSNER